MNKKRFSIQHFIPVTTSTGSPINNNASINLESTTMVNDILKAAGEDTKDQSSCNNNNINNNANVITNNNNNGSNQSDRHPNLQRRKTHFDRRSNGSSPEGNTKFQLGKEDLFHQHLLNNSQEAVLQGQVGEKQEDRRMIKDSKFAQLLLHCKIKQSMRRKLNLLPSRMFRNLLPQHFALINDKSWINQQEQKTLDKNKVMPLLSTTNFEQSFSTMAAEYGETSQYDNCLQKICSAMLKTVQLILAKIPVFNPSSNFKLFWDFLQLCLFAIFMMTIPLNVIYRVSVRDILGAELEQVGLLFLILDNIFYLNIGIYNKGVLITDRWTIFQQWLQNMLLYDFVSIFPLAVEIYITAPYDLTDQIPFLRYTMLLFVFKIERFITIINKYQEIYIQKVRTNNLVGLIKLLIFVLMMGHFFACVFLFIGVNEYNAGKDSWLEFFGIATEGMMVQYMRSYYYAAVTMLTIGYGDITPKTNTETLVCIILMFIACGVFGFTLNSINQIFDSFQKLENEKRRKLIIINNYMKKKHVSKDVQYQIREYLDYVWRENSEEAEDEEKILQQLSDTLREKLLMDANKIVLKDSPVFKKNFSEQILQKTVGLIKEYKCTPEEVIYLEGEKDDCSIFFIEKGSVELFQEIRSKKGKQVIGAHLIHTIDEGLSFGAIQFFSGQPRLFNIRSSDFTTLLYIRRVDFLNLLADYPDDYERFCNIKDNIFLNYKLSLVNSKCSVCGDSGHMVNACPFVHFIPNRSKIIRQLNIDMPQPRQGNHKRKLQKQTLLPSVEKFAEYLVDFQDENESMLDEYELKNGLDLDQLQGEDCTEDQTNPEGAEGAYANVGNDSVDSNTDSTSSEHDGEPSTQSSVQQSSKVSKERRLTSIPAVPTMSNKLNNYTIKVEMDNGGGAGQSVGGSDNGRGSDGFEQIPAALNFQQKATNMAVKLVKDHQIEEIKEEQSEVEDSASSKSAPSPVSSHSSKASASASSSSSSSTSKHSSTNNHNSSHSSSVLQIAREDKKMVKNNEYIDLSPANTKKDLRSPSEHSKSQSQKQKSNTSEHSLPSAKRLPNDMDIPANNKKLHEKSATSIEKSINDRSLNRSGSGNSPHPSQNDNVIPQQIKSPLMQNRKLKRSNSKLQQILQQNNGEEVCRTPRASAAAARHRRGQDRNDSGNHKFNNHSQSQPSKSSSSNNNNTDDDQGSQHRFMRNQPGSLPPMEKSGSALQLIDLGDDSPKEEAKYLVMKGTKNNSYYTSLNAVVANKEKGNSGNSGKPQTQQLSQSKYSSTPQQQQQRRLIAVNASGEIDGFQNKFNEEREDEEELNIFQLDFDENQQFPQIVISSDLENSKMSVSANKTPKDLIKMMEQQQQLQYGKTPVQQKSREDTSSSAVAGPINNFTEGAGSFSQSCEQFNQVQSSSNNKGSHMQKHTSKKTKPQIEIQNNFRNLSKSPRNRGGNKEDQQQPKSNESKSSDHRHIEQKTQQPMHAQQNQSQQSPGIRGKNINFSNSAKQRSNSNHMPRRQSIYSPTLQGIVLSNQQSINSPQASTGAGQAESGQKFIRRSSTLMAGPIPRIVVPTNNAESSGQQQLVNENPIEAITQAKILKRKLSNLQNELTQPSINRLQRKSSLMMNSENQEAVIMNQINSITNIAQASVVNQRRHSSLLIQLPETNNLTTLQQQTQMALQQPLQMPMSSVGGRKNSISNNLNLFVQQQQQQQQQQQTLKVPHSMANNDSTSDQSFQTRHLSLSSQCMSLQNQIQQIDTIKEDQNTKNLLLYWDIYKMENEMRPLDVMKNFQFYFPHNNLDFVINQIRQQGQHNVTLKNVSKFTSMRRKTQARMTIQNNLNKNKRFSVLDGGGLLNIRNTLVSNVPNGSINSNLSSSSIQQPLPQPQQQSQQQTLSQGSGLLQQKQQPLPQLQIQLQMVDSNKPSSDGIFQEKNTPLMENSFLQYNQFGLPLQQLSMSICDPQSSDRIRDDDQEMKSKEKLN